MQNIAQEALERIELVKGSALGAVRSMDGRVVHFHARATKMAPAMRSRQAPLRRQRPHVFSDAALASSASARCRSARSQRWRADVRGMTIQPRLAQCDRRAFGVRGHDTLSSVRAPFAPRDARNMPARHFPFGLGAASQDS